MANDVTSAITLDIVTKMFPGTPVSNIKAHLPNILKALRENDLADASMVLTALATVRAEAPNFEPISEPVSAYNTQAGGRPYDLYDSRADLGNIQPDDGARFKGRGFTPVLGRAAYRNLGRSIGIDLENRPEIANDSYVASLILATVLKHAEAAIRSALEKGDIEQLRRTVNGGTTRISEFSATFRRGQAAIVLAPDYKDPRTR
jgi:peptidoglycan L-alanyl-D-glutamate endopeptidase CwlK